MGKEDGPWHALRPLPLAQPAQVTPVPLVPNPRLGQSLSPLPGIVHAWPLFLPIHISPQRTLRSLTDMTPGRFAAFGPATKRRTPEANDIGRTLV